MYSEKECVCLYYKNQIFINKKKNENKNKNKNKKIIIII